LLFYCLPTNQVGADPFIHMRILVLLPTYNERENIEAVLRQLFALALPLEVLVVDDLSPDGTGRIAEQLKKEYPGCLEVMHREGPRGRGRAGIAAFQYAANRKNIDWVAEMDADGSHPPRFLPDLLKAGESADVVLGSRYVPGGAVQGWGLLRHVNSRVAGWVARWLLGLRVKDPTSGFRLFRHDLITRLPWETMISDNPSIVEEILFHCGLRGARIAEVPILFIDRQEGRSKFSFRLVGRWIHNLWQVRRTASHG